MSADQSAVVLRFGTGRGEDETEPEAGGDWLPATLAMGEGGRLLDLEVPGGGGIEAVGPLDVDISPWPGGAIRQVSVHVHLWRDAGGSLTSIEIPRRGVGYEITYPSGNQ